MVRIGEPYRGCRYWMYEPAEQQRSLRKELRIRIKKAGLKPSAYGLSKIEALQAAQRIETELNIEMAIANHDYL